jgi:hypothetical protein
LGVSATPWPLYSREREPVPIVEEAGWAPGPVWTGAEPLPPLGFDPWAVQPVASGYTDRDIPAHIGNQCGKFVTSLLQDYSASHKVCV